MHSKLAVPVLLAAAVMIAGVVPVRSLAQQPGDANVPLHASNRADDQRVTDQIRKALASDDALSPAAKSVEVAINEQMVVLRGAVSSVDDKERVETIAGQYAGARQVDSELTLRDGGDAATHHLAVQPNS
jgi:osmotically-inducible protein OsmY